MRRPLIAASFAFMLAACGGDDDDDHDHDHDIDAPVGNVDAAIDGAPAPRETVTRSVTLNAGGSDEGELSLVAAGDKIHVRVAASAATLSWNVHTHDGSGTVILQEGNAVSTIDYEITGDPGPYSLLLVNSSGTLTFDVNLDLYGQAQFVSGL